MTSLSLGDIQLETMESLLPQHVVNGGVKRGQTTIYDPLYLKKSNAASTVAKAKGELQPQGSARQLHEPEAAADPAKYLANGSSRLMDEVAQVLEDLLQQETPPTHPVRWTAEELSKRAKKYSQSVRISVQVPVDGAIRCGENTAEPVMVVRGTVDPFVETALELVRPNKAQKTLELKASLCKMLEDSIHQSRAPQTRPTPLGVTNKSGDKSGKILLSGDEGVTFDDVESQDSEPRRQSSPPIKVSLESRQWDPQYLKKQAQGGFSRWTQAGAYPLYGIDTPTVKELDRLCHHIKHDDRKREATFVLLLERDVIYVGESAFRGQVTELLSGYCNRPLTFSETADVLQESLLDDQQGKGSKAKSVTLPQEAIEQAATRAGLGVLEAVTMPFHSSRPILTFSDLDYINKVCSVVCGRPASVEHEASFPPVKGGPGRSGETCLVFVSFGSLRTLQTAMTAAATHLISVDKVDQIQRLHRAVASSKAAHQQEADNSAREAYFGVVKAKRDKLLDRRVARDRKRDRKSVQLKKYLSDPQVHDTDKKPAAELEVQYAAEAVQRAARRLRQDEIFRRIESSEQDQGAIKIQAMLRGWMTRVRKRMEQGVPSPKSRAKLDVDISLSQRYHKEGNYAGTRLILADLEGGYGDWISLATPLPPPVSKRIPRWRQVLKRIQPVVEGDCSSEDESWETVEVEARAFPRLSLRHTRINPHRIALEAMELAGCDDRHFLFNAKLYHQQIQSVQRRATVMLRQMIFFILNASYVGLLQAGRIDSASLQGWVEHSHADWLTLLGNLPLAGMCTPLSGDPILQSTPTTFGQDNWLVVADIPPASSITATLSAPQLPDESGGGEQLLSLPEKAPKRYLSKSKRISRAGSNSSFNNLQGGDSSIHLSESTKSNASIISPPGVVVEPSSPKQHDLSMTPAVPVVLSSDRLGIASTLVGRAASHGGGRRRSSAASTTLAAVELLETTELIPSLAGEEDEGTLGLPPAFQQLHKDLPLIIYRESSATQADWRKVAKLFPPVAEASTAEPAKFHHHIPPQYDGPTAASEVVVVSLNPHPTCYINGVPHLAVNRPQLTRAEVDQSPMSELMAACSIVPNNTKSHQPPGGVVDYLQPHEPSAGTTGVLPTPPVLPPSGPTATRPRPRKQNYSSTGPTLPPSSSAVDPAADGDDEKLNVTVSTQCLLHQVRPKSLSSAQHTEMCWLTVSLSEMEKKFIQWLRSTIEQNDGILRRHLFLTSLHEGESGPQERGGHDVSTCVLTADDLRIVRMQRRKESDASTGSSSGNSIGKQQQPTTGHNPSTKAAARMEKKRLKATGSVSTLQGGGSSSSIYPSNSMEVSASPTMLTAVTTSYGAVSSPRPAESTSVVNLDRQQHNNREQGDVGADTTSPEGNYPENLADVPLLTPLSVLEGADVFGTRLDAYHRLPRREGLGEAIALCDHLNECLSTIKAPLPPPPPPPPAVPVAAGTGRSRVASVSPSPNKLIIGSLERSTSSNTIANRAGLTPRPTPTPNPHMEMPIPPPPPPQPVILLGLTADQDALFYVISCSILVRPVNRSGRYGKNSGGRASGACTSAGTSAWHGLLFEEDVLTVVDQMMSPDLGSLQPLPTTPQSAGSRGEAGGRGRSLFASPPTIQLGEVAFLLNDDVNEISLTQPSPPTDSLLPRNLRPMVESPIKVHLPPGCMKKEEEEEVCVAVDFSAVTKRSLPRSLTQLRALQEFQATYSSSSRSGGGGASLNGIDVLAAARWVDSVLTQTGLYQTLRAPLDDLLEMAACPYLPVLPRALRRELSLQVVQLYEQYLVMVLFHAFMGSNWRSDKLAAIVTQYQAEEEEVEDGQEVLAAPTFRSFLDAHPPLSQLIGDSNPFAYTKGTPLDPFHSQYTCADSRWPSSGYAASLY